MSDDKTEKPADRRDADRREDEDSSYTGPERRKHDRRKPGG